MTTPEKEPDGYVIGRLVKGRGQRDFLILDWDGDVHADKDVAQQELADARTNSPASMYDWQLYSVTRIEGE